jgi:predicted nucleic acid-binding protein
MSERVFLDTNVLIYAASADPAEHRKQAVAQRLLDNDNGALSIQVLHEFLTQITRPTRVAPLTLDRAWQFVAAWRRFPVQENSLAVLDQAYALHGRTQFSLWDCLIVAAAQALGCSILYTEDMQDGRIIDGMRIVNPFREGALLP